MSTSPIECMCGKTGRIERRNLAEWRCPRCKMLWVHHVPRSIECSEEMLVGWRKLHDGVELTADEIDDEISPLPTASAVKVT